jgi:alpha-D-xyloside xylohydrolase
MRKHLSFTLILGILAMSLASASAAVTAAKKLPDGAQFTLDGGTLRVQFWSPEIVRVTYAAAAELPALKSLSVVASPVAVRWTWPQDDQFFILGTPHLKVRVDKQTGAVSFLDADGHLLLREAAQGRQFAPATLAGTAVTSCAQSMAWASISSARGITARAAGAVSSWPRPTPTWGFR